VCLPIAFLIFKKIMSESGEQYTLSFRTRCFSGLVENKGKQVRHALAVLSIRDAPAIAGLICVMFSTSARIRLYSSVVV
jgi:hypothetical protein